MPLHNITKHKNKLLWLCLISFMRLQQRDGCVFLRKHSFEYPRGHIKHTAQGPSWAVEKSSPTDSPGHCWWKWYCRRESRHQRRRWRHQTHPGMSNTWRQASGGGSSLLCPWCQSAREHKRWVKTTGASQTASPTFRRFHLTYTRTDPSSVSPWWHAAQPGYRVGWGARWSWCCTTSSRQCRTEAGGDKFKIQKRNHTGGVRKWVQTKEDKESVMDVCGPYLLREATEELIEELREDEAHVLERFKDRKKDKQRKWAVTCICEETWRI